MTYKKMPDLNFPHQDENTWLYIEVGGVRQQQFPSPLEVKMLVDEALQERDRIAREECNEKCTQQKIL